MRLEVQVFASLKDIVGAPVALLEVPDDCSVEHLLNVFAEVYPRLRDGIGSIRVAINEEYVSSEALLREGDRVALIPPVSGGCDV